MNSKLKDDLANTPGEEKKLQPNTVMIDLPDVKDIPGQENVHPPRLNEYADTTIASADEEADDLFNDEEGQGDSDVTPEEKKLLQRTEDSMASDEDQDVYNAELDDNDEDGDPLNENIDVSGKDLDAEGTDENEEEDEGDEDEENSTYSLGGDTYK